MFNITYKFSLFIFLLLFTVSLLGYAQTIKSNNPYLETSGDILPVALPVTVFATTLILKGHKDGWQFNKDFLANQVITFGMKVAVNKPRRKDNGDYVLRLQNVSKSLITNTA
tara:strand:- start:286 stop:621 length:336 start_codon:yes stop_codon:yes gene_type:complete